MKTLTKLGVVGGLLAALGSGCDNNRDSVTASCEVGDLTVKAIYHERLGQDRVSLRLYKNGARVGEVDINPYYMEHKIQCNDGRSIVFGETFSGPAVPYLEEQ